MLIGPSSTRSHKATTPTDPARSLARPLAALALITAIRLAVATAAPLSPDEAYYWVWSRALAAGYLDHPPMVALWIRAGTTVLGDTSLGVRLLAPLSAAAGSVLLAAAGNLLFPDRRPGLWAAILLNSTLMLGAGAVTITPDTPLIFFWTATLYALARIARGAAPAWWLAVGLSAGLALDSKYTAALLGVGIALWLLTPPMRATLRTPWPWFGGLLAVALTLPVLQWNAAHHWASFAKQGGRAADFHPSLRYLAELLAGQFGLATPIIAVSMVIGLIRATRLWRNPAPALLVALTLPAAAVFLQHAIGDRVQANWVAILYPTAALAAAAFCPRWQRPAAALGLGLTAVLYLQATLAPLPLPRALDPTLRLAGFDTVSTAAASAARQNGAAFIGSEEYGLASLLAWYGHGLPILGNEPRWTVFDHPAILTTAPGLLVISARHTAGPNPDLWQTATLLGTIDRSRGDHVAETYRLYRVTLRPDAPAIELPSPGP